MMVADVAAVVVMVVVRKRGLVGIFTSNSDSH